ncbi:unnamed protein product [Zymoseptoria tritici ST99CH_1A5]|uniref:Uncharacterized protein n=1 Tax=Zymoseptoria tritici ST99CH_1A5 TaxID=1276529 RepID=A0A1Y6LG31_ZYMTR|nr:unnamed protein product [Zymoseptoria tritici ST99CH_3D1]SMY21461.1 unnamed protein product [Zymoseptoria tritici ST99CH_1A5]
MLSTRATMARNAFTTFRLARTQMNLRFNPSTGKGLFSTSNAKALRQARRERFEAFPAVAGMVVGWSAMFYVCFIYDCPCPHEEIGVFGPTRSA